MKSHRVTGVRVLVGLSMNSSLIFLCALGAVLCIVSAKPPEGYRAINDGYHHHQQQHHNHAASGANQPHTTHQALQLSLPEQQQQQQQQQAQRQQLQQVQETRAQPVPLHDLSRLRGVYIDGKPVVAGVPQAIPLSPVKQQGFTPQAQAKAPFDSPPQGVEYYDELPYSGPQSAYIPTAPYPASVYGRPPFWVRLQRWNPFSRLYRTTYTIGSPEYAPPYGYVVPPVMVLPAPPNSKIEPVYSQPLPNPNTQRRYSRY